MGKVILILENDPKNLKLVTVILQVSGYATLQATDGKQGVELARKEKPDLILMDIQIPVMDGLEATKLLKNDGATRDIPVIALTAYAMKGDEEKMRAAGCDGYITKPIDIKGFLKKISEVISK
ncbi:MAG: response regulator [Deltaproteobacteria bacterium]|nr:response regulator [Deltaproteobacteria bacterium]MBW2104643.1 response regulator [Deltaproteobacteria bacterium]RLB22576.1 MAG: two-component system response regulator [Deltaproteobacteria bacterium]